MAAGLRRIPQLLVLAALVAIAGVAAHPPTRWAAVRQARVLVQQWRERDEPAGSLWLPSSRELAAADLAVSQMPGDVAARVSAACDFPFPFGADDAAAVRRLREIAARFPSSPLVRAAIVQRLLSGVSLGVRERRWEPARLRAAVAAPEPPNPAAVAALIADTAAGERADPTNGWFPFTRAIGLLAAARDAEALAALRAAAACPRWTDYRTERLGGRLRVGRAILGGPDALAELGMRSVDPGFSVYSRFRSLARVVVGLAGDAERGGRPDEAIAYRSSLMHCAALWRAESTDIIGVLVSVAVFSIAYHDPLRADRSAPPLTSLTPEERVKRVTERSRRRLEEYCGRLERAGHDGEARWVRAEAAAMARARDIIRRGMETDGPLQDATRVFLWQSAAMVFAVNALFMLVFGGLAALACRKRSVREGRPLSMPVRWGAGLWLGAVPVAILAGAPQEFHSAMSPGEAERLAPGGPASEGAPAPIPFAWVVGLSAGCAAVAGVVAWRKRGRRAGLTAAGCTFLAGVLTRRPGAAGAAAYLAIALAVGGRPRRFAMRPVAATIAASLCTGAAVIALAWCGPTALQETASLLSEEGVRASVVTALLAPGFLMILPLLAVGVLSIAACIRRVPVSVSLARGLRVAALPAASVLVIAWAVALARTVPLEAAARSAQEQRDAHEGRYAAARLGVEWPGRTR